MSDADFERRWHGAEVLRQRLLPYLEPQDARDVQAWYSLHGYDNISSVDRLMEWRAGRAVKAVLPILFESLINMDTQRWRAVLEDLPTDNELSPAQWNAVRDERRLGRV